MSEQLKEAAKRLLHLASMPIEEQKSYVRKWPELGWDGVLLARNYAAEHPAEDEQPIGEDWLLSVGGRWTDQRKERMLLPQGNVLLWMTKSGVWKITDESGESVVVARELYDRGEVRRLCESLGITLKEQS